MMTTALITCITGQDGANLAEALLTRVRAAHGIKRRGAPRAEGFVVREPRE